MGRTRRTACHDGYGSFANLITDNQLMGSFFSILLGGALALGGTWLQAGLQRRSVHAERLWTRRADLYVELLQTRPGAVSEWRLRAQELAARIDAFGSSDVLTLFEAALEAHEREFVYAADNGLVNVLDEPHTHVEPDEELARLMKATMEADARLRHKIRDELGTHSTKARRFLQLSRGV
jgi:hypothetical protein